MTTEEAYLRGLAGASVALVGAAASVTGTRLAGEIEAHDVVARVNWAAPVPPALRPDIGRRTDVLYHILTPTARLRSGVVAWQRAGVKLVISVHNQSRPRFTRYQQYAHRGGPPIIALATLRREMIDALGTTPNTGVIALTHLLRSDLAHLSVYGFDMYRTGHWVGQHGETAAQAAAQAGIVTGHDQPIQRRYLAGLARTEPRLRLRPELLAALDAEEAVHGG